MVPIARHSSCALKKKVGINDVEIKCGQVTLQVRTVMMTSSNRSNAVPDLLSSTTLQNMHCKAGIFPSSFVYYRGFFGEESVFQGQEYIFGRIITSINCGPHYHVIITSRHIYRVYNKKRSPSFVSNYF